MKRTILLGLALLLLTSHSLVACGAWQSVEVHNPSGLREDGTYVDEILQQMMAETGLTKPPLAGQFPKTRLERVRIARDAQAEINDLYYRRGWSDGLPIVPPTRERVRAMLKGTDLPPEQVIGVLEPGRGQATVEKIAVNAVMAGCRPVHLPVVIAAVEAIADPAFNLLGVQTTDENVAPLLIIGGPVAQELDVNGSFGALGPGWQANACIGRALRLVMNNVGGAWPGVNCPSGLAQPGRYTLCLAENAAQSPWPSLQVELGYAKNANTVTVMRAESVINVTWGLPELASVMGSLASAFSVSKGGKVAVIVAPWVAQELAAQGWQKEDVRRYLYERGRISLAEWEESWSYRHAGVPEWAREAAGEGAIPPVRSPEDITVLVAGGHFTIPQHAYLPTWGEACQITREIKLPARWDELLEQGR
jgi:hypothetical protein